MALYNELLQFLVIALRQVCETRQTCKTKETWLDWLA